MPTCTACNKVYSDIDALLQHYIRQPICKEWENTKKNIQTYADNRLLSSKIGLLDEDFWSNKMKYDDYWTNKPCYPKINFGRDLKSIVLDSKK